jgi:glyoxylase-like metal-dependent hydrolase (beta-lactamase superfamily II)
MSIREEVLRSNGEHGSGQVSRFMLEDGKKCLTQITTFCPGGIGPGPTNLYLVEDEALILVDTGMPTNAAKILLYTLFGHPIPSNLRDLPNDLSEKELIEGLSVAGYAVEDIDMILISHGHWDHFLLGKRLVSMSRAKVLAHIADTPIISNPWTAAVFSETAAQQIEGTGMPNPSDLFEFFSKAYVPEDLGFPLRVDKPIFTEGPLLGDASLEGIVIKHLPGHSPGSIGLLLRDQGEEGILISGDVLLYPITGFL